ncbi:MAG: hypothetical protein LZ169_00590, partial [Thaumarchaeota archaeon]|nr:hypothetical protein [Candidatus Wolframiiraptor allenii]
MEDLRRGQAEVRDAIMRLTEGQRRLEEVIAELANGQRKMWRSHPSCIFMTPLPYLGGEVWATSLLPRRFSPWPG